MLSTFFGVSEQLRLKTAIFQFIASPGPCSCNRSQDSADPSLIRLSLDHDLRAGSDQLPVAEIEKRHVGRWIHHAQASVEIKGGVADLRAEFLADHQLKGISSGDVLPGLENRLLEVILRSITGCRGCVPLAGCPVERAHRGKRLGHGVFQDLDALNGIAPCGLWVGKSVVLSRQIGVGHGCNQPFHLIEDEDAVHQHPQSLRRTIPIIRMDRHRGLNPADQFIAPHPVELAERWQSRQGGRLVGRKTRAQGVEGIA